MVRRQLPAGGWERFPPLGSASSVLNLTASFIEFRKPRTRTKICKPSSKPFHAFPPQGGECVLAGIVLGFTGVEDAGPWPSAIKSLATQGGAGSSL